MITKLENGWQSELLSNGKIKISFRGQEVTADSESAAKLLFYKTYYAPLIKQYKTFDIEQKRTAEELMKIYEVITNCCDRGIPAFCEREKEAYERAKKQGMSIREVLDLLTEEWGAIRFKRFFNYEKK